MRRNFTRLSFAAGVAIFREMCYAVPIEYVRRLHMDPIFEIELEDCPVCRGAGVMQDEQGWCVSVACMDCGAEVAARLRSGWRPPGGWRCGGTWERSSTPAWETDTKKEPPTGGSFP